MNKAWVKWLVAALIVIVAAVGTFLVTQRVFASSNAAANLQTAQVTRADIQSSVLSSASLMPASELQLTFGSAGTIAALNVKAGDHVAKGQVIAAIDTAELQLSVEQAQASLSSAQAKLESVKAGAATKDVANAEASVRSAQAKLDGLRIGPTAADLANSRAALDSANAKLASVLAGPNAQDIANAQAALASAQAKLDQLKVGPTAGDLAAAQSSLASAQAKQAQLKIGPTDAELSAARLKVTSTQNNLTKTQSSSSLSRQQAEIALDQADHAVKNAQDKYYSVAADALDANGNLLTEFPSSLRGKYKDLNDLVTQYNAALRALQDAEDNYRKAQLSLNDARQQEILNVGAAQAQFDDANMQLADLLNGPTAADLAAAQASVDQAQNSLDKLKAPPTAADFAAAQASVDQAKNNLDKAKAPPTDADIKAAKASVAQAQANLDKLKAPPTAADLIQAQAGVDQAKNNLDALKAGPLATDLAQAQASVDQAQANLDSAKAKLDDASLKAPFDGVIAEMPVTLGQAVGANAEVVDLVDTSSYHLDMNVGEADISRVKVGQPVEISFDAVSGLTYTGTVTFVAPKATIQQGVVNYLATVTLDPKAASGDSGLRPGMSATASAIVDRHSNALLVPTRAVRTEGRQKVVSLIGPGGKQITVPVVTGISNDTSVEITGDTPLREGDAVVINAPATGTATRTANNGLFNFGGGRNR